MLKVASVAATALFFALSAGAAQAKTYTLTLCGASPGGLWSLLGAGVDSAMKAAYPGSTVTYQTSGGGFANVGLLKAKKCELAIVHDAEAKLALEGKKPFKKAAGDLRAVAVLYNWAPMQFVMNKGFADKHGIKSFEDIVTKKAPVRIAVNKRGNVVSHVIEAMFQAAGASFKDIEGWGGQVVFAASKEMSGLIKDRRIDAFGNGVFVRHRSVRQPGEAVDLTLLNVSDATIGKIRSSWKIGKYTIKGGSYKWAPQDVHTVALSAQLVALESMSDKDAYNITKALIQNVGKVSGVHKAMKKLDAKLMAGSSTPYHAGSTKAYKEAGLK